MRFEVSGRLIGNGAPALVVAELGINHGGDVNVALNLARIAIDSGAEAIKLQTHDLSDEMSVEAECVFPVNSKESIAAIIRNCALDEEEERHVADYVRNRGAIFFSTPFSINAVTRLEKLDVPMVKIGSGEAANLPLIEAACSLGKPLIISTGMQSIDSIEPTIEIVRRHNLPFALLHCTNLYPCPPELIRLGGIQDLRGAFPDAVVGFSDHSESPYAALGAIALGASIIEKHFTDSKRRTGPDIAASMDPDQLGTLLEGSRVLAAASGGSRAPLEEEQSTMRFAFTSVAAVQDINAGDQLTLDNIRLMRPATGHYGPKDLPYLLGRVAKFRVPNGHQLPMDCVL